MGGWRAGGDCGPRGGLPSATLRCCLLAGAPWRGLPRGRTSVGLGCASLHGDALLGIPSDPFQPVQLRSPVQPKPQLRAVIPGGATPSQPTHSPGCSPSPVPWELGMLWMCRHPRGAWRRAGCVCGGVIFPKSRSDPPAPRSRAPGGHTLQGRSWALSKGALRAW